MEEDSVFGLPSSGPPCESDACLLLASLPPLPSSRSVTGHAGGPNVKGKITGQDKLVPDVYAEAAKPESRRWTWREPSPSVAAQFRTLSANPSRDLCIAATTSGNAGPQEAIRMTVTGGRVFPTTIVVSPGTPLAFKNFDPFKHRLYVVGNASFKAEDMAPNQVRSWSAIGRREVRDPRRALPERPHLRDRRPAGRPGRLSRSRRRIRAHAARR